MKPRFKRLYYDQHSIYYLFTRVLGAAACLSRANSSHKSKNFLKFLRLAMAAVIKNPAIHQTNTAIRQKKNANGTGSTKSKPTVTAVSTKVNMPGIMLLI